MPFSGGGSGGGSATLSGLTDVSVIPNAGTDQFGLVYNFSTNKWKMQRINATQPDTSAWNPADKLSNCTLSNSNLTCTTTNAGTTGARSVSARSTGKYYFEIKLNAFQTSGFNYAGGGIALSTFNLAGSLGADTKSAAYDSHSFSFFYNGTNKGNLGAPSVNDVICFAVDCDNKTAWCRRNAGTWLNSGTANPATNTGGVDISAMLNAGAIYMLSGISDSTGNTTLNAGASAFAQAVPAGFSPWDLFAAQAQAVGASPASITAPGNGSIVVNAGTVSAITFQRGTGAAVTLGIVSGIIPVYTGDVISITYTVAPTVTFIPA